MFELQWRKKYQPLHLLQVFYPSMSAKLTPQEYGKAWFPVWKEKKIYGRPTLGILQKKIALSSRAILIKASLKGLPSRVS